MRNKDLCLGDLNSKEQRDGLSPDGVIQKWETEGSVDSNSWNIPVEQFSTSLAYKSIAYRHSGPPIEPRFARRLPKATVLPLARELPNQRSTAARCLPRAYSGRQAGESPRLAAGAARALRRDWQNGTCLEGVARRVGAPRRRREAPERSSSAGACASGGCPTAPRAAQTGRSTCGRTERASGSGRASRAVASRSLVPRNRPAPRAAACATELRTRSTNAAKHRDPSHRGTRSPACWARGHRSRRGGPCPMSGVD
jgi:hypothetical protein